MGLLERLSAWVSGGAPATVLVLGLDGSGKTSLLAALRAPASPAGAAGAAGATGITGAAGAADSAESAAPTAPTVGHTQEHFQCGGVSFRAWDAPGAARLRALWERHYRRADAIIFVVDSSDHLRLVVAREELELVLAHPDVRARRPPLLVLANKSDAPHALPAPRVAAALGLERVTEAAWHVGACSARGGAGLRDALTWLARRLRDRPR